MTEEVKPAAPKSKAFDLQDCLLAVGLVCIVCGVAHFSVAVAFIFTGMVLLGFCYLLTAAKQLDRRRVERESAKQRVRY